MIYRNLSLLLLPFLIVACGKEKKCEDIIDEAYIYPLEAAKGKTFEEKIELFKIPDQVLHCLSTKALIQSCIKHPNMSLMWTMSDLQGGFDKVEDYCNGYGELWKRSDKYRNVYNLYSQLDFNREWLSFTDLQNGYYMDNIVRYELILAQYEILKNLSHSEKIELFQIALDNQKTKYSNISHWGLVGMETTCAILSRIMYLDGYKPLIDEYNSNNLMPIHISNFTLIGGEDLVKRIMDLSDGYLIKLKSQ